MLATNPVTANLIKARELIADEKNWVRGQPMDSENGPFCAVAAVRNVTGVHGGYYGEIPEGLLLIKAASERGYYEASTLNDALGHTAVMRMFDRAIELSLA